MSRKSKFTFFATETYTFDSSHITDFHWDKFKKYTLKSKRLYSKYTDKKFIGQINRPEFRVISSRIGRGAFSVLNGSISSETQTGVLKIQIHLAFRILISLYLGMVSLGVLAFLIISQRTGVAFFFPVIGMVIFILAVRIIVNQVLLKALSRRSITDLKIMLDIDELTFKEK